MNNLFLNNWRKNFIAGALLSLSSATSFASTVGTLPFNSTMNILKDAISGPFLLSAAIILIVVTCLMLAFGEWGEGFKKLINIVLWLSIAFAASNFAATLFGSGAVF
ncbi:MAG: TrbC/VirB2 family protein [Gammaproteobacteria bacterium]|nr:TrbC/VirB2 family protein [Gammaproteobacteria bacterium]